MNYWPKASCQMHLSVWESAVDETRELVDMMETARSYQNNVEVMQTAKSLIIDTLKLGR